jgi:hypothetical protein
MKCFFKYICSIILCLLIQNEGFCQTNTPNDNKTSLTKECKLLYITNTQTSYSISPEDSIAIVWKGYGDSAKIISYDITVGLNGLFHTASQGGAYFPQFVIQFIHRLPSGSLFILSNIRYKPAHGNTRISQGMKVKIL